MGDNLQIVYNWYILTDMKRMLITLDEETANLLDKKVNKSQAVRDALRVYNEDISTDTLEGMRQAFRITHKKLEELETQIVYLSELIEKLNGRVGDF